MLCGTRCRREPWHLPHIAQPHAAVPKPGYSDVAQRFWLDLADSRERRLAGEGCGLKNTTS